MKPKIWAIIPFTENICQFLKSGMKRKGGGSDSAVRDIDRPAAEKPWVQSFIRLKELSVLSLANNSGKAKI